MKTFINENTWLQEYNGLDVGWGYGFVIIPKGHPLWGKSYDELFDLMPELDVHGGISFIESVDNLDWPELTDKDKGGWIVGFDATHLGDNLTNWPREKVIEETEKLKQQLENYKKS